MNEIKENSINNVFICPNNCNFIPEISYSYELFNPLIKYKCNSKNHGFIEEKMKLEEFLKKTSLNINCSLCNSLIVDEEFIYSKINKIFYHIKCLKNNGIINNNDFAIISSSYLFNNCLEHNNKFRFYCKDCKVSLCLKCDIPSHDESGHILEQIISLKNSQKNIDAFKAVINKQKILLNKIKDMNNKLIQSFENDIILKEKIFYNYKNNDYNFQSIQNYNNFKLNNNKKYENILDYIINKNNELEKKRNNENYEEIFINTILSPLYYSMMINENKNFNNNVNNLINKIINSNEKLNSKNNIDYFKKDDKIKNNFEFTKKNNNENRTNFQNINDNKKNIEIKDKIKNKENCQNQIDIVNNIEIKRIKQQKMIFNMIILHTGNIATSSINSVTIYDSNNLLSPNEEDYLLQRINISNDKKVSYVFEFPDETLFCAIFGKIFRIKLIDNDKNYIILGIIELKKREIPSILISLGNSILSVLTIINGHSFIRLFIKEEELEYKNNSIKNYGNNLFINDNLDQLDDNEKYNSDNQSAGVLNDYYDYLDKKYIEKDKEFYPFSKDNNLNLDKKLLCSIYEIKNYNNNQEKKIYMNLLQHLIQHMIMVKIN